MKKTLRKGAMLCVLTLIGALVLTTTLTGCSDDPKSSARDILSFSITVDEVIHEGVLFGDIIEVYMDFGTDVTALTPEIEVSNKATVTPTGARNFTNPVNYTVKAEDGTFKNYVVRVIVGTCDENHVLAFSIGDVNGYIEGTHIVITLPAGTDVTALTPVITIPENATVTPTGARDFTNPVNYIVTSNSGNVSIYTVKVLIEDEIITVGYKLEIGLVGQETIVFWSQDGVIDQSEVVQLSLSGEDGPSSMIISFNQGYAIDAIYVNGTASTSTPRLHNIFEIKAIDYAINRTNVADIIFTKLENGIRYSTSLRFIVEE